MTIRKLKNHPYASCHVLSDGSKIAFVSYSTPVILITTHAETGEAMIECTGTYSATTRKQIGYFLKEYVPSLSYQDMKRIVGKGAILLADI